MASYSLNKLKADAKARSFSAKMLIRCGSYDIPDFLSGVRTVTGANSVSIKFLLNSKPPIPSELRFSRANLMEYTGDFLVTFYPGIREPNPAEQQVLDEWEAISSTPEFQEQSDIDALSDGAVTYWKEKNFFLSSKFRYLYGTQEERGLKRILGGKNHGKIQDENIRGDVEMVYRLYHHVDGKCPENCDKPIYPDWQTAQYIIDDTGGFTKTLSFAEVKREFCLDGSDKCISIKDQTYFRSGVQCRVYPLEKSGLYAIKL